MSRLLRVNRSFLLDVNLPELEQWHPVLVVSGEQDRFPERYPDNRSDDGELVQEYLSWDDDCPVGIAASVYWARENARTIRDVVSLEMWEALNALWHWLRRGQGRRLYGRDRDAFYKHIKDAVALFHGVCHDTMLHEQPFDFMRLGMLLERAAQTARIMDVKYHLLGPTSDGATETPIETAQWIALLRSCSAEDTYFRRNQTTLHRGPVVEFLLHEEQFPRSVFHCLTRAANFLRRIKAATGGRADSSADMLEALVESIRGQSVEDILTTGLHTELTRIIDTSATVCAAIHRDYFDPSFSQQDAQNVPTMSA